MKLPVLRRNLLLHIKTFFCIQQEWILLGLISNLKVHLKPMTTNDNSSNNNKLHKTTTHKKTINVYNKRFPNVDA